MWALLAQMTLPPPVDSPAIIFANLTLASPSVLAIMSYFFERCDIFEDYDSHVVKDSTA
ncbi:MAG: hypothetical protein GDA52_10455 [Rhodobacteraceae bacterium]|nr:hypothetical protein [Paracoccaceae bacterium]